MNLWNIKRGDFTASIYVNALGDLPKVKIKKLLRLAATADDPDCLLSLARMLPYAIAEEKGKLIDLETKTMDEALSLSPAELAHLSVADKTRLYASLVRKQKRRIVNLQKIKNMEEIKNYEQED